MAKPFAGRKQWLMEHFYRHMRGRNLDCEDVMSSKGQRLFHSLLSFALNVKMLHPLEMVQRAETAYRSGDTYALLRIAAHSSAMNNRFVACRTTSSRMCRTQQQRRLPWHCAFPRGLPHRFSVRHSCFPSPQPQPQPIRRLRRRAA
jgi:hypothetical protein